MVSKIDKPIFRQSAEEYLLEVTKKRKKSKKNDEFKDMLTKEIEKLKGKKKD